MKLKHRKVIAIDIDGTICDELPYGVRNLAEPYLWARDKANQWFNEGHLIFYYTARPWQEYTITKKWLDDNDFKYTGLVCGKLYYDYIIDDRSEDWDHI